MYTLYIYIHTHIHIYAYIYIYKGGAREGACVGCVCMRERERDPPATPPPLSACGVAAGAVRSSVACCRGCKGCSLLQGLQGLLVAQLHAAGAAAAVRCCRGCRGCSLLSGVLMSD
jgi:hypothetical protein